MYLLSTSMGTFERTHHVTPCPQCINCRVTKAFTERTGSEMHCYHAVDIHKKALITDVAIVENLQE